MDGPFCKCQLVKSDNLQYNMVGRWDDSMIVRQSDAPMFVLIDWEYFGETWSLRSYETVKKGFDFTHFFSSRKRIDR